MNGTHYNQVSGTAIIPNGSTTKELTIIPKNDNDQSVAIKTAIIMITSMSTYIVGTTATDTVNIRQIDGDFPPEFLSNGETDARNGTNDRFDFYMGADQRDNRTFQRVLNAEDPDNTPTDPNRHPITWSIDDTSGNFQIDPANGTLSLKPAATLTVNTTVKFKATVMSNGVTDTADVTVNIVTAFSLTTIDFTTDHNKLRRNTVNNTSHTEFAYQNGGRFNSVEWSTGLYADPLSHTMGQKVELLVRLPGVPDGMKFDLVGEAVGTDLDFKVEGENGAGQATYANLTATDPLPANVGQIDKAISWTITIDGQAIFLVDTQNLIYVTYGVPQSITYPSERKRGARYVAENRSDPNYMTERRIAWLTSSAVAGGLSDIQDIITAIHAASQGYDPVDNPTGLSVFGGGQTPDTIWTFLDATNPFTGNNNPGDGECKDHVRLIHAAANMLGITVGKIGFVFPRLEEADKGEYSTDPGIGSLPKPGVPDVFLWYIDSNGARNRYEAVYKVVTGPEGSEVEKYYGGFSSVFDSVQEVMDVAASLIWMRFRRNDVVDEGVPFPFQ